MKNKIIIIFLIFEITFFACTNQKQHSKLRFKYRIENLLDSIMKINQPNKIYELYIDKIDPYNSNLLFYIGPISLTEKENVINNIQPCCQIKLNDKLIDIYCGLEKYIIYSNKNLEVNKNNINNNEIFWAIEDRNGVIINYKMDGGYPFMPFPVHLDVKPAPPIINIK